LRIVWKYDLGMPIALSHDLRSRIVAAVDDGLHYKDVAETFRVHPDSVRRLLIIREQTGSLAPKPHGGGAGKVLSDEQRAILRRCQEKWPDKGIADLGWVFSRATGKPVSDSMVGSLIVLR
jgi:transposase